VLLRLVNCWVVLSASKGVARLQLKRRQSRQVKHRRRVSRGIQGAERGGSGEGPREESGEGLDPPRKFLLFDLKMEYFDAAFKLDLTEETMMQLQEKEAIASSCLTLATPMSVSRCTLL